MGFLLPMVLGNLTPRAIIADRDDMASSFMTNMAGGAGGAWLATMIGVTISGGPLSGRFGL